MAQVINTNTMSLNA
ncbi:hypothetical protein WJ66_00588, partial [Stenotrophomonas maltophilia WJ66]